MRENLETYLAGSDQACELGPNVPLHIEATYRQYLKCGMESLRDPACGDDWPTGSPESIAPTVAMIFSSRSAARVATSVLLAPPAGWSRRPPI